MAIPSDVNGISGASVEVRFGLLDPPRALGDGGNTGTNVIIPKRTLTAVEVADISHEILATTIKFSGEIRNPEPLCVAFKLFRPDGTVLETPGSSCHPTPGSAGFEWWNWTIHGAVWNGIGSDLTVPGVYRIQMTVVSGQVISGNYQLYFEVTGEEPPPEPPPHGKIIGKVTDSILGINLQRVQVIFGPSRAETDIDGWYEIRTPGYSGQLRFEFPQYIPSQFYMSVGPGMEVRQDVQLVKAVPPPPEYKVFPAPPVGFPAAFIPYYKELDLAVFNKDKAEVLRIFREHAWETASPAVFVASMAAALAAMGFIVTLVGSVPFAAFLFEETLQTLDMAIFTAQKEKQWDLAAEAVAKKKELLTSGMWEEIYYAMPIYNVVLAVKEYIKASKFKTEIDDKIISRQVARVVQPEPGEIAEYKIALDLGTDPKPFLPLAPALLRINANAPGGTIKIDDLGYSAAFPFEIELKAGDYTVEIGAEGKQSLAKAVTLTPYDDKIVDFFLKDVEVIPPEEMGTLNVSSTPIGAKIYINFVFLFEYTNTSIKVEPGTHTLTLKKSGYRDHSETFSIRAAETKDISVTLTPVEEPPPPTPPPDEVVPEEEIVIPLEPGLAEYNAWKVTIRGIDALTKADLAAWILVNDIFMGRTTPAFFYLKPEAEYNIKLRMKGYRQGETTFTTKALPTL